MFKAFLGFLLAMNRSLTLIKYDLWIWLTFKSFLKEKKRKMKKKIVSADFQWDSSDLSIFCQIEKINCWWIREKFDIFWINSSKCHTYLWVVSSLISISFKL